jgi:hypothetical protein
MGPPPPWVTSNCGVPVPPADTSPNAAFIDDPAVVSDKRLDSLHFPVGAYSPQVIFRHNFNLEASDIKPDLGFDGGVLELSTVGGNTFQDVLAAGGALRWAATTAQSAPSELAPSLVGRLGVATLAASSQLWWTYLSCRLAAGYAGGWLVI